MKRTFKKRKAALKTKPWKVVMLAKPVQKAKVVYQKKKPKNKVKKAKRKPIQYKETKPMNVLEQKLKELAQTAGEAIGEVRDKMNTRTEESIKARLLHTISNNKLISGRHDFDEGYFEIVRQSALDKDFDSALGVVARKCLDMFPNEEIEDKPEEEEKNGKLAEGSKKKVEDDDGDPDDDDN